MSDTQDAGTTTNDAGETQNVDAGQPAAVEGQDAAAPAEAPANEQKTDESQDTEVEYTFEMPEGFELDAKTADEFKAIAKDAKLPADVAQKFMALAVQREQARVEAHKSQVNDWREAVMADKELGKPENLAVAKKAIETFGTPELRALLNDTGFGNHPEIVKLAYSIGKAISEDAIVGNKGDAPVVPRDPASILYPNQAKA